MQLKSVETTPNPNSMKLNLSEQLGSAVTYSTEDKLDAPDWVKQLLEIDGIRSVFLCADFVTLNKDPRADWKPILDSAIAIVTGKAGTVETEQQRRKLAEKEGQGSCARRRRSREYQFRSRLSMLRMKMRFRRPTVQRCSDEDTGPNRCELFGRTLLAGSRNQIWCARGSGSRSKG